MSRFWRMHVKSWAAFAEPTLWTPALKYISTKIQCQSRSRNMRKCRFCKTACPRKRSKRQKGPGIGMLFTACPLVELLPCWSLSKACFFVSVLSALLPLKTTGWRIYRPFLKDGFRPLIGQPHACLNGSSSLAATRASFPNSRYFALSLATRTRSACRRLLHLLYWLHGLPGFLFRISPLSLFLVTYLAFCCQFFYGIERVIAEDKHLNTSTRQG